MSSASFYKWRAKYGGMDASLISEMKQPEDENKRLKRMFADLSMQNELLKEAIDVSACAILGCFYRRCPAPQASMQG